MATIPQPPPPPPLPAISGSTVPSFKSTTLRTTSTLPRSDGPPTNSNNVGSLRSTSQTPNRGPLANIHPEELQHAIKCLRPSQYNKPIPSSEPSQGMGRSPELPSGGYRQSGSQYATLEQYPAREQISAPNSSPYASSEIRFNHGYSVPLSQAPQSQQQYSSNYTTNTTKTNYNSSVPPPLPSQPPPSFGSSPNQNYSSNVTYSYVDPQNYVIKESYQSQPTNNNGIQTYKTYTSTTTSYLGGNNNSKNQPNIQLNSQPQFQQQFQQQQQLPPSSNYINNPKTFIYDYATKTPIAVLDSPSNQQPQQQNNSTYSYSSSYSTTNNNNTFGASKQPSSYAEELRNSSLSENQRKSNLNQQSFVAPDRPLPQSFHNVYEERIRTNQRTDQVDDLVKDMEMRLRTGRDICAKCQTPIQGETPGVTALGKPYHVNCFSCDACQKQLAGCSFYNVDGKNLCQVDYMNSLEKCEKCSTPITQKILRALGKPFHPECFVCPSCQKSLDGIPFTVSKDNVAYCLDCYHDQFSPRCAVCLKAIAPSGAETEVARVIAMNKSYHVTCYRCEDCGLQLNSKVEGAACYPLESHLFCKQCNLARLKAIS